MKKPVCLLSHFAWGGGLMQLIPSQLGPGLTGKH